MPACARRSAQASPAGPAPITATVWPVGCTAVMSGRQPVASAVSTMYFSTAPMVTAPNSSSVQLPSHRRSCGHTRPHTSGNGLVLWHSVAASWMRFSCTSCSHCGMALCTGHFQLQYGLPQSRQRPAWYCASSVPNFPYSSPQSPEVRSSTGMRCGMVRGRSRNWKACLRLLADSVDFRMPASGRHYSGGEAGAPSACGASVTCGVSRRAAQGFGQRLDAGGLGFDQPELADVITELVHDLLRPDAAGQFAMTADQAVQVLAVVLEPFGGDAMDVDQLVVVAVDEIAVHVQHVGQATGEAGTEVEADLAQH